MNNLQTQGPDEGRKTYIHLSSQKQSLNLEKAILILFYAYRILQVEIVVFGRIFVIEVVKHLF